MPLTPDDLDRHDCLAYVIPRTGRYREWEFASGSRRWLKLVSGGININNAQALVEMACAGMGIARVANFLLVEPLRQARVVTVLAEYAPAPVPIHAVYAASRYVSPKLRVFLDFVMALLPPDER